MNLRVFSQNVQFDPYPSYNKAQKSTPSVSYS